MLRLRWLSWGCVGAVRWQWFSGPWRVEALDGGEGGWRSLPLNLVLRLLCAVTTKDGLGWSSGFDVSFLFFFFNF